MTAQEIITKNGLDKKKWVNKEFHGILHFFFSVGEMPVIPMKRFYGDGHSITVFYFGNNLGCWYWNEEDLTRLRGKFIVDCQKDDAFLDKIVKEWQKRLIDFDAVMAEVDKTNFTALSDEALYKLYVKFHEAYREEFFLAIGWQDAFSMKADEFMIPHLHKVLGEKGVTDQMNAHIELLTSAVVDTFITKEHKDRLKCWAKVLSGGLSEKQVQRLFARHAKKYHWVNNNYAKAHRLDANYFMNLPYPATVMKIEQELRSFKEKLTAVKTSKQALIKKLKLDVYTKLLIRITEVFAYMQDERKKYMMTAVSYQDRFCSEYAKRLGIPREEAEYTYIYELPELMAKRGSLDRSVFRDRKKSVLVINTQDGWQIYQGSVALDVYSKIFKTETADIKEIKGMIACKGIARGKVRVIRKAHDLPKMVQGEVLVASMTRPEMVIAMNKASAIVTNEGGITSHAAVVSRELGIPCIIGTKIATETLKDGMSVEVDAEKGIVRIL